MLTPMLPIFFSLSSESKASTPSPNTRGTDASTLTLLAIGEAELKTSGNNAGVGLPGVAQEAVMKSGSNTFHGDAQGDFERPSLQANNITAAEAAPPNNLKFGNPLAGDAYYDYAADIGGRIIRNRLWFYGGLSKQLINEGQASFKGGPDAAGCWTCADAPNALLLSDLPQYDDKVSYQLTSRTQGDVFAVVGPKASQQPKRFPDQSLFLLHSTSYSPAISGR